MTHVRALVAALATLVSASGCGTRDRELEWTVSFADSALAGEARGIEAWVLRGDCISSERVFEASFDVTSVGPRPPSLPPGAYAFAAVARNGACESVARGCTPITLPLPDGSSVNTLLQPVTTPTACDSGATCVDGLCLSPSEDGGTDDCTAASCARVVPSNVAATRGVGTDVTLGTSMTYDTTLCVAAPFGTAATRLQSDDTPACVVSVHDLTLETGAVLSVRGDLPLVILAEGTVTIDGTIDAGAHADVPGPGGGVGGRIEASVDPREAAGPFPGARGGEAGNFADGGGGGGGLCGAGGRGGNAEFLANGGEGGAGFTSAPLLVPLRGGSGGGATRPGETLGPLGGAGGGAIQISSQADILVRGAILAGGGGGGGGAPAIGGLNYPAGAGGGSGGAILLEARRIELSGVLGASGGGGGGSAGGSDSPGESGRDGGAADAAGGDPGAGSFSATGGAGGGSRALDGESGGSNASGNSANGGGGGGGAGCIVLRTLDGMLPAGADRSNPPPGPAFRALSVQVE